MSTQTQLPELPSFQNQIQDHKSLLDEPWKVTLIPTGAPVGEDPCAAKSLPWRVGDVTRLKDDSPKGMMEYIATHSTGWWHEMAQRALRDTEKAESMAREAGWQHGQYWALEVDSEAKQKLLEAEEAKRAREEAERAKEEAEKQAFIQRGRWSCWRERGGLRGANTSTRTAEAADRRRYEANAGATDTRR